MKLVDTWPNEMINIASEIRIALSADIKASPYSRFQIALRMSNLTEQKITASMLNNWTAESHNKYRFPCEFMPAFVIATGGRTRALEIITRNSQAFLLPGMKGLRAEIQKLNGEIKIKREEKKIRMIFLKQYERQTK